MARRSCWSAFACAALLGFCGSAHANLVGYWTFDPADISGTTALDASGYGNNGTIYGGATQVPGIIGGALSGDGNDDYVEIPHSASLNLNNPMSVGTWIQATEAGAWFRALVCKFGVTGAQTPFWGLGWMETNRLGFAVRDGSNVRSRALAPTTPPILGLDGAWHHVLGVRGNGRVQYYMDGDLIDDQPDTTGNMTNTKPITLARHYDSTTGNTVQVVLDDVAIWDERLTPGQAYTLGKMLAPANTVSAYSNLILESNPAAYWRLEETVSVAKVADWTGNNRTGTATSTIGRGAAHTLTYDPLNAGVVLNGTSDYLSIDGSLPASLFSGGSYSVELWFNADTLHQGDLAAFTTAAGHGILLELEANGTIRFLHRWPAGGGGGTDLYSSTLYSPDEWHHLVAVKDGSDMKLFIDGLLDPVTMTDGTTINGALDLAFGRLGKSLTGRNFDGMLDEIALYDRALSAAEILDHFVGIPEPTSLSLLALGALGLLRRRRRTFPRKLHSGRMNMPARLSVASKALVVACFILGLAGVGRANLVSYWPLDDGTGSSTAANTVGGMPNGTLTNMDPNTDWVTGHNGSGYALDFDGSNDWVDLGTNATLNAINNPLTASAWARTTAGGGWYNAIFCKFGGTPFWGLGWINANYLGFVVRGSSPVAGDFRADGPQNWGRDGAWHHHLGLRGNGKVTYFGDGEVLDTRADNGTSTVNTATLRLGSHNATQFVAERIDDPALWDQRLSMRQIQALALPSGTYTPATLPPASAFPQNAIEESAPAAYWRLEETIAGGGAGDWSGNDYHLNGFGTVTRSVAHPLWYDADNRAMDFDGSSGYFANRASGTGQPIGAPLLAADFAGGGSYSIELWFNADTLHQGAMVSLAQAGSSTNYFLLLETETDGTLRFLHRVPPSSAATGTNLYSSILYTIGDWHHVAVVNDAGTMKMYIDGLLDPNQTVDLNVLAVDLDVAIGRLSRNDSQRYFNGLLDEIAFYDYALTYEEVLYHYAAFGIPEPTSLTLLALGALALLRRRRRRA